MYNSCMELAQHTHADQTQAHHDPIIAAFLEPGALPDIAKRVNMSLASLANWASKHADLLDSVHKLLVARCKLIAAQIELSAFCALATVSDATTPTDDPKLRERSLERRRKAASAILRHKNTIERTPRASNANPERKLEVTCALGHSSDPHAPTPVSSRVSPSLRAASPSKPSLEQRIAARRLAAMNAS